MSAEARNRTSAPSEARSGSRPVRGRESLPPRIVLALVLLYVVLEYARPAGLQQLHLQFLIIAILPVVWLIFSDRHLPPVLIAQWAFLGLCAFAIPFAYNNFAAYFTTRVMFGNLSLALGISWILGFWRYFVVGTWCWVAVMAYVAIFALLSGGIGPGGFIGDQNDVALGLCTAVPFAFFGIERFSGWRRLLCIATMALLVSATVATLSRGGFVGLLAVFGYCLLVSRRKLVNSVVLGVAAVVFVIFAPQEYMSEVESITQTEKGTAVHRFYTWTAAYRMWLDSPIVGTGAGNFRYVVGHYQPMSGDWPSEYFERDWAGTAAHSMYFELLGEHGVVGFGIVAFLVVSHFRILRRTRRRARRKRELPHTIQKDADLYGPALAAAMVGFLASGAFLSVTYYPYLWYLPALAVAFHRAWSRLPPSGRRQRPRGREAPAATNPATRARRTEAYGISRGNVARRSRQDRGRVRGGTEDEGWDE